MSKTTLFIRIMIAMVSLAMALLVFRNPDDAIALQVFLFLLLGLNHLMVLEAQGIKKEPESTSALLLYMRRVAFVFAAADFTCAGVAWLLSQSELQQWAIIWAMLALSCGFLAGFARKTNITQQKG